MATELAAPEVEFLGKVLNFLNENGFGPRELYLEVKVKDDWSDSVVAEFDGSEGIGNWHLILSDDKED